MTKNRFVSLILVLICMVLLCGCANVEYMRVTDDTGKIVDKLTIELNETQILQNANELTLISLKADIASDIKNYKDSINARKLELKPQHPDLDFDLGVTVLTTGWINAGQGVSKIAIEVTYLSQQHMQLIFGIEDNPEEDDKAEPNIISNLFISKYLIESDNVYIDVEESDYFKYYSSKYSSFNIKDVNLTQVYGTSDDRLKSNADHKATIDGINYHLWEIDTQNGEYKTLKLGYYYLTAVGTGWYIVALGISMALALILVLVAVVKHYKNKRYKTKIKKDKING